MATVELHFDSVLEQVEKADQCCFEKGEHRKAEGGVTRSSFIGRAFENWQDCVQKANEKWDEGIKTITGMMEEIRHLTLPQPTSRKRKSRWSEEDGDEVDMYRLWHGEAFWRETRRQSVRATQHVSIVTNIGALAHVPAHQILWRGAASIILADLLEQAGYSVELIVMERAYRVYKDGDDYLFTLALKKPEQPVDTATLVNAISGWYFRTICFQSRYIAKTPRPNLGCSSYVQMHAEKRYKRPGTKLVVIDSLWSKGEAVDMIKQVISELEQE